MANPTRTAMRLPACTAEELMTTTVRSISEDSTVREAIALMTEGSFLAAPVINESGRPVGVVSCTDILIHEREYTHHALLEDQTDWDVPPLPLHARPSVEVVDPTRVCEIMTPTVFCVKLNASAKEVIEQLEGLKIHHLFVVDDDGVLVGVITAMDVLKHLVAE